ncbi:hypothetical protein ACFLWY_05700 [Chloroflexota bacterium]
MPEHPLQTLEKLDPGLLGLVEDTRRTALGDGALPVKFKIGVWWAILGSNQ